MRMPPGQGDGPRTVVAHRPGVSARRGHRVALRSHPCVALSSTPVHATMYRMPLALSIPCWLPLSPLGP